MAGLNAGDLDRDVTIQQLTQAPGTSGFPVDTWTTLDVVPMSKDDQRGRERFQIAQVSASYDTKWRLHFRDDMDPDVVDVPKTRRLSYRGRTHDITEAVEIGRREGILLLTLASTAS